MANKNYDLKAVNFYDDEGNCVQYTEEEHERDLKRYLDNFLRAQTPYDVSREGRHHLKYPSLDEVLKAYDIHFSKNGSCKGCIYEVKGEFDGSCIVRMEKDLHKYVMMLKEANQELMMRLFRSEQLK